MIPVPIIITGFGPFGGAPDNPSSTLVNTIISNTTIEGYMNEGPNNFQIVQHAILDTSVEGAKELQKLQKLPASFHLHLGVHGGAKQIHVENQAFNNDDFRIPDNKGIQLNNHTIAPECPEIYQTSIDVCKLVESLGEGYCVSNDPGRFLCNHVFFQSLRWCATCDGTKHCLFVHVPPFSVVSFKDQYQLILTLLNTLCKDFNTFANGIPTSKTLVANNTGGNFVPSVNVNNINSNKGKDKEEENKDNKDGKSGSGKRKRGNGNNNNNSNKGKDKEEENKDNKDGKSGSGKRKRGNGNNNNNSDIVPINITLQQHQLLSQIVRRIVTNPDDPKYRSISSTSKKLLSILGTRANEILTTLGFTYINDTKVFTLINNADDLQEVLQTVFHIHKEIVNVKRAKIEGTGTATGTVSTTSSSSSSSSFSNPPPSSIVVYCDRCNKTRYLLSHEYNAETLSNDAWTCSLISTRMPETCKEPDDELKEIIGRKYAAVFQLMGIINREHLAAADVTTLTQAAGGDEFYYLIQGWVMEAQKAELADAMVVAFEGVQTDVETALKWVGVTSPVDLMEQSNTTWKMLLQERCGVEVELKQLEIWRTNCKELLNKNKWMMEWRYDVMKTSDKKS